MGDRPHESISYQTLDRRGPHLGRYPAGGGFIIDMVDTAVFTNYSVPFSSNGGIYEYDYSCIVAVDGIAAGGG